MARRGRPTVEITLSADERATLERWCRRYSSSQGLALRSRIVLAAATGRSNTAIAAELGVHPTTVAKWRHRFATDRLDGLADAPGPGAARTIGDDVVEAVVIDTLESGPPDSTHWSTRGLAAKHASATRRCGSSGRPSGSSRGQDKYKIYPDPDLVERSVTWWRCT